MNLKGLIVKKKSTWNYPDLKSARPVLDWEEVHKVHEEKESSGSDSGGSMFESSSSILEQFKQEELSDLIRDLNLFKKQQKFWHPGSKTKSAVEPEFRQHFTVGAKKNYFCISGNKKKLFMAKTSEGFY